MVLDPQTINNLIMGGTAWGLAFLAALWLSLILWTYRDISSRKRNPVTRILAVIIVALLFVPGIIIYLILRPPHTMEEEYQHVLEEEALVQSIEDPQVCPGCGRHIQATWMVCPNCHTRLMKACQECHQLLELGWNLCPYCGTPVPGMRERTHPEDHTNQPNPAGEEISAVKNETVEDEFSDFIHVVEKPEK